MARRTRTTRSSNQVDDRCDEWDAAKHASVPLRRVRAGELRGEEVLYELKAGLPPDQIADAIRCTVEELLTGLLAYLGCEPSPLTPTAVKHNVSNDQRKRAQHRIWPQLTKPAPEAVSLLSASRPAQAAEAPPQMANGQSP